MRTSLSQVENIQQLDDEKPLRDIHRRNQKVFDLNDAQTLKVREPKINRIMDFFSRYFRMKSINRLKIQLVNFLFSKKKMNQLVNNFSFLIG